MIWSVIKAGIFILLAIGLAFGLTHILETPGSVRIAFGDREFFFEPIGFVVAILLLLLSFWLLLKLVGFLVALLHFIVGDETAISRYFNRNRERRGYDALAEGMIALASGEGATAIAKATKAERLLKRPELTRLLNAQAAEMSGNREQALKYYKQLLQDNRTRFVGIRGILKQKLEEGDTDTALKLAEKAFALRPKHHGNLDTLFALQSEKSDWSGARQTLGAKQRAHALPKDVVRRRDAILSLAEAQMAMKAGDIEAARNAVLQANALVPTLIPAAALAAQVRAEDGNKRAATKIIKTAWQDMPHPDLVAAFGAIEPDESLINRHKRFQQLIKIHPDHIETKLLEAELALADEDFPTARRVIGTLAEDHPTTRTLAIMAAIEQGSGADETVVRAFLARALTASRGDQWVCSNCGHAHSEWVPTCTNCGAFDTLEWKEPPVTDTDAPMEAVMPLIVGKPPAPDEPPEVQEEATNPVEIIDADPIEDDQT